MNPQQQCQQPGQQNGTSALSLCSDAFSGCTQYPRFFAFKNISDWCPRVSIPVHFVGQVNYVNILHLSWFLLKKYVRGISTSIFPKKFLITIVLCRPWFLTPCSNWHSPASANYNKSLHTQSSLFLHSSLFFLFLNTLQLRLTWFSSYDTALWALLTINWENVDYRVLGSTYFPNSSHCLLMMQRKHFVPVLWPLQNSNTAYR